MKRGTVNPWQIANRSHRFVAPAMHIKSSSYSLHRKSVVVKTTEGDAERRKQLVWAIERKLAEDGARPIIFYSRGGTCWQPRSSRFAISTHRIRISLTRFSQTRANRPS